MKTEAPKASETRDGIQPGGAKTNRSKQEVADHYREVAQHAAYEGRECCWLEASGSEAPLLYPEDALAGIPGTSLAASRGCGDPVAQAQLQPGERVLDLGSGGGVDAIIAARLVGAEGRVWGLDMVPDMVELARRSAQEAQVRNVEFIEGDIAHIDLPDASVNAVISNCVINFCDDKEAVFREAFRVLAPGGRIVVSDIVAFKPLPAASREALQEITGCRFGITDAHAYAQQLAACGFTHASIDEKTIYTLEVLREKALRKHHERAFETVCEQGGAGCTGSAIIRGWKGRTA